MNFKFLINSLGVIDREKQSPWLKPWALRLCGDY